MGDEDPEVERRLNRSYYIGQVAGLEEASTVLQRLAVARFEIGQDREAINLRGIATDLKKMSEERRKEADKKFGK